MSGRLGSLVLPAPARAHPLGASPAERAPAGVVPGGPPPRVLATAISKSYRSGPVLRDVDLALAPSSLVAVAGGNGVGKSTLLGCLAGTIRHRGSVLLEGQPVVRARRGRVAYLPQRLRLPASATGREVGRLFAALGDGRPDRVELPPGFLPPLDKPIGQLSGGQAQRLALAAVLSGQPELILLDEPFANLDDDAREGAQALLRAHRDAGATVLVASPTAIDLLALADRVVLVRDGRIDFDGPPSRYAGGLDVAAWAGSGA